MIYVAAFVWVMVWFATGYFTIGAIRYHIEYRRTSKQLAQYYQLLSEVDRALEKES